MANRKLGKFAIEEIREEIARCVAPAEISREAQRLAAQFGVSKNRI